MPLFDWMKRPRVEKVAARAPVSPGVALMRELQWYMGEWEHRSWLALRPHALLSPTEHRQLELLCSQVKPTHTAAVLSRFREVLAGNNILPWELTPLFKQVLRDFLSAQDEEEEDGLPTAAWVPRIKETESSEGSQAPFCSMTHREEIPTISSHVDRSMRWPRPYGAPPHYCPAPHSYPVGYSTTL